MVGDYEVSSEIYSEHNYITREKPKLDKKSNTHTNVCNFLKHFTIVGFQMLFQDSSLFIHLKHHNQTVMVI